MIEDTSSHDRRVHLAGLDIEGPTTYIEAMEAEGQQQLLSSNQLPRHAKPHWDAFEALGIRRGENVGGLDGLFCTATLPDGWTRQASQNPIWTSLIDERGLKRVEIFYKAAFYDRSAFMTLVEHPGRVLASDVIYSQSPAALPPQWDVLTDTERADFRQLIDEMHADIQNRRIQDFGQKTRIETLISLMQP